MARPVVVDPYVTNVTVIQMRSNGRAPTPSNLGSATGFFYKKEVSLYLITNKHVVINEERRHFPDELILRVHTNLHSLIDNRDIHIPLYLNGNPVWLEHPTLENVDVVAICIDDHVREMDVIQSWSSQNFVPEDELINYGDSVLVMGYPRGFYDTMHNLPIGRSGTIASLYRGHFEGRPYFLLDAVLHPGTSGSPVYIPTRQSRTTVHGLVIGASPPVLLGINSGSFEPLGLHTIWYAELIEEIIPHAR